MASAHPIAWEVAGDADTTRLAHKASPGTTFSLMSWNILADGLAQTGDFTVDPAILEWEPRSRLIASRIAEVGADLLALQELNHFPWLAKRLGHHQPLYVPKLDSPAVKCGCAPDGSGLFIRKRRFTVLDARIVYYKDDDAGDGALSNQAGIATLLRDTAVGKLLVVGTTHLKAKGGAACAIMRESQAKQLLAVIESLLDAAATSHGYPSPVPVLVCGDFNSPPSEGVFGTMRGHLLKFASAYNRFTKLHRPTAAGADAGGAAAAAAPKDAAAAAVADADADAVDAATYAAGEPPFTTWKYRHSHGGGAPTAKKQTIDYIWVSQGRWPPSPPAGSAGAVAVAADAGGAVGGAAAAAAGGAAAAAGPVPVPVQLRVIDRTLIPSEDEIGPGALPTAWFPSDHVHIAAMFQWA